MADLLSTAVQVGLPVLAGGGLAAMYLKWRLARADEDRSRKRELIALWRTKLVEDWPTDLQNYGRGFDFMAKPEYFGLRPHLSDVFKVAIDRALATGETTTLVSRDGRLPTMRTDFPRSELADEIGRIEREWKLLG